MSHSLLREILVFAKFEQRWDEPDHEFLKSEILFAREMGKEAQEMLKNSRIPNLMSPVAGSRVGTCQPG